MTEGQARQDGEPAVEAGSAVDGTFDRRAGPIHTPAPQVVEASQMTAFTRDFAAHTGAEFRSWQDLHAYCVQHSREFWRFFLQWCGPGLRLGGSIDPVRIGQTCEEARFFPGLDLNYADSLLNLDVAGADAPAVTACRADGRRKRWTRRELRAAVEALAQSLAALGVQPGDRVAALLRNDDLAVLAALAAAAVGATLSTSSPDMGVEAILDRFRPIGPRLLFTHVAPRPWDTGLPLADKAAALCDGLPSVTTVVPLDGDTLGRPVAATVIALDELPRGNSARPFGWPAFGFNHPLFIMFSSGTTGRPKCIVHGAGGSLLEHLKEHRLHCDLRPGDRLYFHTGCSWMMWNWQLSALASGVEIVTYDGPIAAVDTLWRLVADERVTVFGTSPPYLRMCQEAGLAPAQRFDLGALRAILSTGSVLHDEQFEWVAQAVKDLPLQSISGGTDILGCFVLGNPNLPVWAGEAQCVSLGLDIQARDAGTAAPGMGQLVCANPFPSRPVGFWGDPHGVAFHDAYFSQAAGVWSHGDLVSFPPGGGVRLHGRCDGVLNVRGIKFAPGEIERVLVGIPGVREAMVVERRPGGCEQQIVALLVLADGIALDAALVSTARREIARRLTTAHVPDLLLDVPALPVTHSGKLSGAAARDAINGRAGANAGALRNPDCLEAIGGHPMLRPTPVPACGDAGAGGLAGQLGALWARLFGIASVEPDANFFELGGNSLLAARLMAQVKALTGRDLPLSTLLRAPTAETLADLLSHEPDASSSRLLIPMRTGAGRPLYLIHGLSGTLLECWALVERLRTARPVYGFQAPGVDGEQPPLRTVEALAAAYAREIRAAQPSGPYTLAGYSFGGLVALEIARALVAEGQAVETVCLIDAYVQQDLSRTRCALERCARGLRTVAALPLRQVLPYLRGAFRGAGGGRDPGRSLAARARTGRGRALSPAQQGVFDALADALESYRPQPFGGCAITYLRARIPLGGYPDPLPVWRRIAVAGLRVMPLQGGHLDLVGAHVEGAAGAIDAVLAASARGTGSRLPSAWPAMPLERLGGAGK